jgi:hypothetical protein
MAKFRFLNSSASLCQFERSREPNQNRKCLLVRAMSRIDKLLLFSFLLFTITSDITFAQKQGDVWCFGDSALIDWTDPENPIIGTSAIDSRGSCSSVSTPEGELLFYVGDIYALDPDLPEEYIYAYSKYGIAFNRYHQVMPNGYGLIGEAWYHEHVIIPMPESTTKYYIVSLVESAQTDTLVPSIYYSIVDMQADSGRGDVVLKNQLLYQFQGNVPYSPAMLDASLAFQHGNGRDWWLFNGQSNGIYVPSGDTAILVKHLITPEGIAIDTTERISLTPDTALIGGIGEMVLSPDGNKLLFVSKVGKLSEYSIDRCTGKLSLERILYHTKIDIETNEFLSDVLLSTWAEYSPSSNIFYFTIDDVTFHPKQLYQINLADIDPYENKYLVHTFENITDFENNDFYADLAGELLLAPDNKIYLGTWYYNGFFNWPYPDTSDFTETSMNLSVINSPDSLGPACDFELYSFPLGGNRTYIGLPNNPNYRLGPLDGSPCDTLGINALQEIKPNNRPRAFTYPTPAKETVWLSIGEKAFKAGANPPRVTLYGINGKKVFETKVQQLPVQLNISKLHSGVYSGRLTFSGAEYYFKVVKE